MDSIRQRTLDYGRTIKLAAILCCAIGQVSASAAAAPAEELGQLLKHLEERNGKISSLAVKFSQEKRFSFMTKPIVSTGFMLFAHPGRIRFDIVEPFQTSLLDNGKKMGRYEFADGQWRAMQLGGGKSVKLVMEQIGQWIQGKFSTQEDIFNLSVMAGDPNDYIVLSLQPKHKQFLQYIKEIRIHISAPPGYGITRIDILEPEGDSFALVFGSELINSPLPEEYFIRPETAGACLGLFGVKAEGKK
jgi:outer membrane lipoprotein-sorting protein